MGSYLPFGGKVSGGAVVVSIVVIAFFVVTGAAVVTGGGTVVAGVTVAAAVVVSGAVVVVTGTVVATVVTSGRLSTALLQEARVTVIIIAVKNIANRFMLTLLYYISVLCARVCKWLGKNPHRIFCGGSVLFCGRLCGEFRGGEVQLARFFEFPNENGEGEDYRCNKDDCEHLF